MRNTATADQLTPESLPTVASRAALAVDTKKHEARLVALAKDAKTITAITNKDGYAEAHSARMVLKNTRIEITKTSKEAREDAKAFSDAVIAEERRLIAIISPEETRLEKLQKDWDDAIEAEKQRKIAEEAARVQAVKDRIENIRHLPMQALNKPSECVRELIRACEEASVDEAAFGEHTALAAIVKADAMTALAGLLDTAIKNEAEQARINAERAELEALREQSRKEQEARAERERIQAEQDAARQKAERAEAERKQRETDEALRLQREESARLARELEALRKTAEPVPASATPPAPEAKPEPATKIDPEMPAGEFPNDTDEPPTDAEIIEVIADHFDVSMETARGWIIGIKFSSF